MSNCVVSIAKCKHTQEDKKKTIMKIKKKGYTIFALKIDVIWELEAVLQVMSMDSRIANKDKTILSLQLEELEPVFMGEKIQTYKIKNIK